MAYLPTLVLLLTDKHGMLRKQLALVTMEILLMFGEYGNINCIFRFLYAFMHFSNKPYDCKSEILPELPNISTTDVYNGEYDL